MMRLPPSPIRIDGDTAYIHLKGGLEAIIDAADILLVKLYRWRKMEGHAGNFYACTGQHSNMVILHRLIMGAQRGQNIDHRDGDGLNNRRSNLRFCTPRENNANSIVTRRNKLGVKGVSERGKRFRACVTQDGVRVDLGTFNTIEEASAAYIGAAKILWGEFARK